ncbi:MAG: TolA-binding protein [Planctomycetota bacterium]|jgi:TolA-binding protein
MQMSVTPMKCLRRGAATILALSASFVLGLENEASAAPATPSTSPTSAPSVQSTKLDKVLRRNPRSGKVTTLSGIITENALSGVTLDKSGKDQTINTEEVLRIEWGAFPTSFSDGKSYVARGDFENAVARFQEAAGNAAAREVIQAAARLNSAEALLAWGAIDAGQFANCIAECDRFLSEYADNREVPRARWLKGRATRLSNDAAGAAAIFQGIYQEASTERPTAGYERSMCMLAGLDAADALLEAKQGADASTLYLAIETSLASMIAAITDLGSPERSRLVAARGKAAAGEGFAHLAEGRLPQALTFFQGRLGSTDIATAERHAATLGLAEVYMAQNKIRLAQVEFAKVAAVDHTDRDRVARALLGLAQSTMQLGDSDATVSARRYLNDVKNRFGDTPSALQASALLNTL